jgi:hypothetical protein
MVTMGCTRPAPKYADPMLRRDDLPVTSRDPFPIAADSISTNLFIPHSSSVYAGSGRLIWGFCDDLGALGA